MWNIAGYVLYTDQSTGLFIYYLFIYLFIYSFIYLFCTPDIQKKTSSSPYKASTGQNFNWSHQASALQNEVHNFMQCKGEGHSMTCMDRHKQQVEVYLQTLSTPDGCGQSPPRSDRLTPGTDPVPNVQEAK
jgi:hypothetical protein